MSVVDWMEEDYSEEFVSKAWLVNWIIKVNEEGIVEVGSINQDKNRSEFED